MSKKDIGSQITFENIKRLMESKHYIATDKIVWDTIKTMKKLLNGPQKGQDIYSTCLEGPPGSGKTFYVKTYKKLLEDLLGESVRMIEYQCDSTTGKTDLYEDIRVASAITGNPEDVIISGKLIEAIEAVNEGQKVIVLLDEFEKSRRETDSFMFQFLQDGVVITSQKGRIEVKPEYRQNLQVFLCKNDERELSDPLLRRNHRIELEIMSPENFKRTVEMNLPETDEDIRNVVILLYQKMYGKKEEFAKFPSCSEGMLGIQDACTLLEANAPADIIYADILSNMLKHPDDIDTFRVLFENDAQLSGFVKSILGTEERDDNKARKEIYRSFFAEEIRELAAMEKDYRGRIAENKAEYDRQVAEEQARHKKEMEDKTAEHEREMQKRESETEKYKMAYEKIEATKIRLQKQIEQLKQGKDKEDIGRDNTSQEVSSGTQVEEIQVGGQAIQDADIIELNKEDIDALTILPVPVGLTNSPESVFDRSNKWYEIGRIEVEEDRAYEWLKLDDYIVKCLLKENRREFFLNYWTNKKMWFCSEDEKNKPFVLKALQDTTISEWIDFLIANKEDVKDIYRSTNPNKKCIDGIVLFEETIYNDYEKYLETKDAVSGVYSKIIATKVIENGREYYVVYSNHPFLVCENLQQLYHSDGTDHGKEPGDIFLINFPTLLYRTVKVKNEEFNFIYLCNAMGSKYYPPMQDTYMLEDYDGLPVDELFLKDGSSIINMRDDRIKKCHGKMSYIVDRLISSTNDNGYKKERRKNEIFQTKKFKEFKAMLLGKNIGNTPIIEGEER